jgi:hypothetical protein
MLNFRRTAGLMLVALLFANVAPAVPQDGRERTTRPYKVRFARGKTSTTVTRAITPDVRDEYELRARAGQRMQVRVESDDPGVVLEVSAAVGLEALELSPADAPGREWSGELPKADAYYITVYTSGEGAQYTLEVSIA